MSHSSSRALQRCGFTFVEAIFTIAIIGIMASLAISAVSNMARDASRVVARQQQAAIQEGLHAWVMSQTRVGNTAQIQSLSAIRSFYNAIGSTSARFELLVPKPLAADPNARAGFIDETTAEHFQKFTTSTDRLKSDALATSKQYLSLPNWADGTFPQVDLVDE